MGGMNQAQSMEVPKARWRWFSGFLSPWLSYYFPKQVKKTIRSQVKLARPQHSYKFTPDSQIINVAASGAHCSAHLFFAMSDAVDLILYNEYLKKRFVRRTYYRRQPRPHYSLVGEIAVCRGGGRGGPKHKTPPFEIGGTRLTGAESLRRDVNTEKHSQNTVPL